MSTITRTRPILSNPNLDAYCIRKYGHPYRKPYEEGDDTKLFLPSRAFGTFVVYNRYKTCSPEQGDGGRRYVHAYGCYCYQGANICTDCRPLNTTHVYGVDVPMDPERFSELKNMVTSRVGLTSVQFYNWVCFWIFQIIPKRHHTDSSTPIFFMYRRLYDKLRTPYALMFFLFTFIKNNIHTKAYADLNYIDHKSCFAKHSSHEVRLSTFGALVKWSLQVYTRGDFMTECRTPLGRHRHHSIFTSSSDPQHDQFHTMMKNAFHTCLTEIRNEVAYRPGNVSMLNARDNFQSSLLLCRE